ncbi:MAG: ATP-binding cassette domain-containing protein [Syntrophomonadaceae bacterium]|nr:ATP-binding cassette domain-containing protein [Syntrophomonadaceae bacterium]
MLRLEDLSFFVHNNGESKHILSNINLEIQRGKLYGITGPNGGGKTTLAKVIMGILPHTSGHIYLDGEDISDKSITERANLGIAYAFQQPPRFKGLTVEDLVKIAQPKLGSLSIRKKMRDVGLCPEDYLDRDMASGLSGGEMKRIEILQVLARNAKLAIFDEPEAGVDLWTIQRLIDIIIGKYQKNPETAAVLITHNRNILPICDEILVIDEGKIKKQGSCDEIWPLIRDDIVCQVQDTCRGEEII